MLSGFGAGWLTPVLAFDGLRLFTLRSGKTMIRGNEWFRKDRSSFSQSYNETRLLSLMSALQVKSGTADFAI